jgi:hypothetical protein
MLTSLFAVVKNKVKVLVLMIIVFFNGHIKRILLRVQKKTTPSRRLLKTKFFLNLSIFVESDINYMVRSVTKIWRIYKRRNRGGRDGGRKNRVMERPS